MVKKAFLLREMHEGHVRNLCYSYNRIFYYYFTSCSHFLPFLSALSPSLLLNSLPPPSTTTLFLFRKLLTSHGYLQNMAYHIVVSLSSRPWILRLDKATYLPKASKVVRDSASRYCWGPTRRSSPTVTCMLRA